MRINKKIRAEKEDEKMDKIDEIAQEQYEELKKMRKMLETMDKRIQELNSRVQILELNAMMPNMTVHVFDNNETTDVCPICGLPPEDGHCLVRHAHHENPDATICIYCTCPLCSPRC